MTFTSEILDRLPPQDLTAEQGVIGSVLLNPRVLDELGRLKPEDFYADAHRRLFGHLLWLHDQRQAIDAISLGERLKTAGDFEAIGGAAYLANIAESVPVAAHAGYYAGLVRKKAKLRSIIHAATEMLRDAYDPAANPDELLAAAEQSLGQIETGEYEGDPVTAKQAATEMMAHVDAVRARTKQAGVFTGVVHLDEQIGGLFPGELSILAARPGVGKTALALQIAYYVAATGRCAYFASLEMSRVELVLRLACGLAGVNSREVRTGSIAQENIESLIRSANEVANAGLWIHDRPALSIYEIRRAARKIHRKRLDLIVVDYLQLLTPADTRVNREQQVATASRALKQLARELEVPVLCLCQLNRAGETEDEPQLRHLRESGAIEQDADMVFFLGRGVKWETEEKPDPRHGMLWLRKNRNGELVRLRLQWIPERTRFEAPEVLRYAEFDRFGD